MAKIPPHAKQVFKGVIFDVYQWEQVLFDGSTATFEAARRLASMQVLAITPEGKLIMLREEQPYVGRFSAIPGGKVERGDTPEETVKKELREELGMEAESIELWRKSSGGSILHWDAYSFIARNCRRVSEPKLEPGEKIEPYEVTFDQFLEEIEKPEFRNKRFAELMFRIRHTLGELERFKRQLFGNPD